MFKSNVLLIFALITLQGCALKTELLIPYAGIGRIASDSPLLRNIELGQVQFGKEASFPYYQPYRIGQQEFADILKRSLDDRGLLANSEQQARYQLTAFLVEIDPAHEGFDVTYRVLVRYTLSDKHSGAIMDELVRNSYSVTFNQEFVGLMREKHAMEGVFRENIAEFFRRLSSFRPLESVGGK